MQQNKRIVVIGGGIIGCSTALFLAKKGAKVTLIEQGEIGHGCSYGNAGWLTPCFAMPLPMPGMLLKSIGWLLNPNSPLHIKPSPSPDLIKWLWTFMRNMNEAQALAAIEALIETSMHSLQLYRELHERNPDKISFEQKGLLMVGTTPSGVDSIVQELELGAKFGVQGQILNAEDIKKLEPAVVGKTLGGVHFINEAHCEPLATVQTIAAEAKALGVEILEQHSFLRWELFQSKVASVHVRNDKHESRDISCDQVVLATGSWSKALGKDLGLRIPILGGKGYSMILPKLSNQPKIPIMYLEKKIAITPRKDSLRIAGTLELVDQDFSITKRRVQNIKNGASEILDIPTNPVVKELWTGLRPCTPDGVPMIGRAKNIENLILACGHQMLGLQSGIGSGHLVAEIADGKELTKTQKVYDPNRF